MVNPQLFDYIRQQLAAGVSKEEIVKSLLANNWPVSDINEAFDSINSPVPPQPQLTQAAPAPIQTGNTQTLIPVGQLFSDSWVLYKQRLPVLFTLLAIPYAFSLAGQLLFTDGDVLLKGIFALVSFLISIPIIAALILAISKGIGFLDSFQQGVRLTFPLLWAGILLVLVEIGGMMMFIIPGILMMVWFSFSFFVLIIEGKRGLNALLQSREYVRGYWWAIWWRVVLMSMVISISVSVFSSLALLVLGKTSGIVAYYVLLALATPFATVYAYKVYQNLTILKPTLATTAPTSGRGFLILSGILGLITPVVLVVVFGALLLALAPNIVQTLVQNNNATITSGESSQQTIVAQQSTLLSGASMAFVVNKYPQDATFWSLRVDCGANTTAQLIAVASDLKTPVGEIVNCNQDIALDKEPYAAYPQEIIFSMKALNTKAVGDETLTIVSKTFDTAGAVLNQSSFPVTVQAYTEGFLKNDLARIVFQSDSYSYTHQQGGFTGFCTSNDPDGILSIENDLKNISPSVVCKDSKNAWAISVQLPNNPSQYWCADNTIAINTFAPIVRSSPITTTSCK